MNRIKQVRQMRELRQQDLAKRLGVTQSTLSHWENGVYEPDISAIHKMCIILDVSADYLLGRAAVSETPSEPVTIPILGSVPAGIPLEAIEDVLGWEEIPASMCNGGQEYFALQIKGASMEPRMRDGDVVIVRKQDSAETGDTVVVLVNGNSATVKKIKYGPDGISLIPSNPAYDVQFYSAADVERLPVRVIGRVVELRAKY